MQADRKHAKTPIAIYKLAVNRICALVITSNVLNQSNMISMLFFPWRKLFMFNINSKSNFFPLDSKWNWDRKRQPKNTLCILHTLRCWTFGIDIFRLDCFFIYCNCVNCNCDNSEMVYCHRHAHAPLYDILNSNRVRERNHIVFAQKQWQ